MPDSGTHTHDDSDPLKGMRNLSVGKIVVLTEDLPDEETAEDLDEGGNNMNTEDKFLNENFFTFTYSR